MFLVRRGNLLIAVFVHLFHLILILFFSFFFRDFVRFSRVRDPAARAAAGTEREPGFEIPSGLNFSFGIFKIFKI